MREFDLRQAQVSLSHRDATLEQEGSNLIDDPGTLADQPLTHAMQRLQVELIGHLRGHERQIRN